MAAKYEINKVTAGKFRFQLKAAKGEINAAAVKVVRRPDRIEVGAQSTVRCRELMKKAMGASLATAIALTPLGISSARAHAEDPCVSITDPAAHQICIDKSQTDDSTRGPRMGDCQASPNYGQEGQFCRNLWVRKSGPSNARPPRRAAIP